VVNDPYLVAKDAGAIVILTEWPEFRSLDWTRLVTEVDQAVIVETRNLLDGRLLSGTGFLLLSTGTAKMDRAEDAISKPHTK
jgi:UDPglucose 6-dehydrogenase